MEPNVVPGFNLRPGLEVKSLAPDLLGLTLDLN